MCIKFVTVEWFGQIGQEMVDGWRVKLCDDYCNINTNAVCIVYKIISCYVASSWIDVSSIMLFIDTDYNDCPVFVCFYGGYWYASRFVFTSQYVLL